MDLDDVASIETVLQIRLPESYRAILLDDPCADSQDITLHGLYNTPARLIGANQSHRSDGWFGIEWPNEYFVIGDTGCGDSYFMYLGHGDAVYLADHEGGPHPIESLETCKAFDHIADHVQHEIKEELAYLEEVRLAEDRKRNKKWWQFWL